MIKKMLLLSSIGLLGASLALAQDTPATGQSTAPSTPNSTDTSANAGSVQGCLSGSDGNYMLAQDGTGTSFKLVGDETQLKKHVGHEVAVTGQTTGDSGSASASNQGQGDASANSNPAAAMTIQVTDVKMISKRCSSGTPQSH